MISEFGAYIFGGSGIIATFMYYSQNKRLKSAEARSAEIDNLFRVIASLKEEIERLQVKQKSLEDRLNDKDKLVSSLYREIEARELKESNLQRSINCALTCKVKSSECPVLLKKAELEDKR